MTEMPKVSPGEWIWIGENGEVPAVVCKVYERISVAGGNIEVVFLDDRNRAINLDVKWTGNNWEFVIQGDYGGYADRYNRLQPYVRILRSGQNEVGRKRKGMGKSKRKLIRHRSLKSRGRG
jgi:hypothetical protein